MRRLDKLPFLRYGLAVKPKLLQAIKPGEDLIKVWQGTSPDEFVQYFKKVENSVFNQCIYLLKSLYDEQKQDMPFSSMVEKSIVTQIAVILYRQWDLKRNKNEVSSMSQQMYDIKEYIDQHYIEDLNLNGLSEQFIFTL